MEKAVGPAAARTRPRPTPEGEPLGDGIGAACKRGRVGGWVGEGGIKRRAPNGTRPAPLEPQRQRPAMIGPIIM